MHLFVSLVVVLASVTLCNGFSSQSVSPNTTVAPGSSTAIRGVVWVTEPVTITIAANVTEVETFYPGGGAPDDTTFTLTGPTTFITSYIDGNNVGYTYSTTLSTFTVASGITKTETLLSSVDMSHLTGDLSSGGYPWEVDTTFVLTGPTVFVTPGVTVGGVVEDSPPYALESSPATNLDVTTTATTSVSTAAPSPIDTATVFNPQPASSSSATRPPMSISTSNEASSVRSLEEESSAFVVSEGATNIQGQSTTTNPHIVGGSEYMTTPRPSATFVHASSLLPYSRSMPLPPVLIPFLTIAGLSASILNPSAIIIGSQTITMDSPALTIASIAVSLNSAEIIAGSSTIPLPTPPIYLSSPPVITIGAEAITLLPSGIAIAGSTLTPGATGITVDGTPISLDSSALVVGTKTEVFLTPTQAESAGLAPLILSGLGQIVTSSGAPAMTSHGPQTSKTLLVGGARRIDCVTGWRSWVVGLLIGVGLCC
ncbi:mucin 5B, oligomeric mucus gel-forming [Xylographa vitiligo]|nr:mucin 5B, oligomeric mucus gel-forming [Xylographa vitiligo]